MPSPEHSRIAPDVQPETLGKRAPTPSTWTFFQTAALLDGGLAVMHLRVLGALGSFADPKRIVSVDSRVFADLLGINVEAIDASIEHLVRRGWLTRRPNFIGDAQPASYRLTDVGAAS